MPVRTVVERGLKEKRSVAFALAWPGWNRGAATAELAVETLESYRECYRPIADLAGMAREFDAAGPLEVVVASAMSESLCSGSYARAVGKLVAGDLASAWDAIVLIGRQETSRPASRAATAAFA
jgi:hypothetical protein